MCASYCNSNLNKRYKAYLLDLDGTIYRGKQAIPEAIDFVKRLQAAKLPYLFLTNNSSQTKQQVVDKISGFGLAVSIEQVYTSSMAAARYLANNSSITKKSEISVYVIGEDGLYEALREEGIAVTEEYHPEQAPTHVIMGIDRAISYQKLANACLAVRAGAKLLATNLDKAVPTERGLVPGNGSLVAAVVESTGVQPLATGKPSPIIAEYALEHLNKQNANCTAADVVMVGDNFDTDILTAKNFKMDSMLVYTGLMTAEALPEKVEAHSYKPTWIVNSLAEWQLC